MNEEEQGDWACRIIAALFVIATCVYLGFLFMAALNNYFPPLEGP